MSIIFTIMNTPTKWISAARLVVFFVFCQNIKADGLELNKNLEDYRNLRVEFHDSLSGLNLVLSYGNLEETAKKGAKLSITCDVNNSKEASVNLTPDEVKLIHAEICHLVNVFSINDDNNLGALESRLDRVVTFGFQLNIYSLEQGVTLRYSHLDRNKL